MSEVWYVAYGSNMLAKRFHAYLFGGYDVSYGGAHTGARDKALPSAERLVHLPHELYFAGTSRRWSGPVAFVALERSEDSIVLGRAYLVRRSQMEDVVAQENGRRSIEGVAHLPSPGQHVEVDVDGKYNALLGLDECDGCPAVTLTTSRALPPGLPTQPYLAVIEKGLHEMAALYGDRVSAYLPALVSRARRDDTS